MELTQYIPAVDFVNDEKELSLLLGQLAHAVVNGSQLPEISSKEIQKAKKAGILGENDSPVFSSKELLSFFFILHVTNDAVKSFSADEEWIEFLNNCHLPASKSVREKAGNRFYDLTLLICHRCFNINIPSLIAERRVTHRLWLTSYWHILPHVVADVSHTISALFVATEGITAEQNYFSLNIAVRVCAKTNPEFGRRLIEESKSSVVRLNLFCPFAFTGLTQALGIVKTLPIIEDLLNAPQKDQQRIALNSLSMLHGDGDEPQHAEDKIIPMLDIVEAKKDDNLNGALIYVYGLLINKLSNARQKLFDIPQAQPGKDCFHALTGIMNIQVEKEMDATWFKNGLAIVPKYPDHHIGTYSQLCWMFREFLKTNPSVVFKYLEDFILEEQNDLKNIHAFEDLFETMADTNKELLEKWLTLWFNSDNSRFHRLIHEVFSMLSVHKTKDLKLHRETINQLSPYDIEYILIKVAGYVSSKEHLQSLIYSALAYSGDISLIQQIVTELFCHYILYNYPSALDYLLERKAGAGKDELVVIQAIEEYDKAVYRPGISKPAELSPSPERLQMLYRKTFEGLNGKMERSPFKGPSLMDMFAKVSLKTGKHFFTRENHDYGSSKRYANKSTMGHIQESFEMPSGEFIDPVGQHYNRYMWRTFKRRQP